jgi:hypothetical protein
VRCSSTWPRTAACTLRLCWRRSRSPEPVERRS